MSKQVKIAFIIFLVMIIGSFVNSQFNTRSNKVKKIDALEFEKLITDESVFVLDVHTPVQTHIPGTDAFIPYDQISDSLDKLPQDKNKSIVVYCRSGSMSDQATQELIKLGFENVYDLIGGSNAYKEKVSPKIVLSPESQDLGTVIYGEVATTTFILTNFTAEKLKITRISTSCGCTKAEVEKEEIEPYESIVVNVFFDPAVHEDFSALGDLTRTIYIETDNNNFASLEGTIEAKVIQQ